MEKKTVVELFAGVGGFRLGLEKAGWKTIFANQWEPGKTNQYAFDCYNTRFNDGTGTNVDVATLKADEIPNHTLLCGGFPCQDYSVASTLANSKGIEGKKGVLWWEIRRIIEAKKPKYVLLENVDRLLKSPASQRGRDFGIILSCFCSLGYSVEWRVINAADYGFPQRRRRVFIFATRLKTYYGKDTSQKIILESGLFAKGFPAIINAAKKTHEIEIPNDLVYITKNFHAEFQNAGFCKDFKCVTIPVFPNYKGPYTTLGDILETNVSEKYYVSDEDLQKWKYMKGPKKEKRTGRNGFEYNYSEGPIPYPDYLDRAGRTMLTSEGSKNRSSHIVRDPKTGRIRILTPVECERLDGFPDNWTDTMPERMRYFCMGNALVVGLIEIMGKTIK